MSVVPLHTETCRIPGCPEDAVSRGPRWNLCEEHKEQERAKARGEQGSAANRRTAEEAGSVEATIRHRLVPAARSLDKAAEQNRKAKSKAKDASDGLNRAVADFGDVLRSLEGIADELIGPRVPPQEAA